jgi:hypothetical protein
MHSYLNKIDACLKNIEQHWPQYHIDGTRNIWILKPGAKSRGRGLLYTQIRAVIYVQFLLLLFRNRCL